MISQWVWNLRLELGHQLKPQPLRTTEFAPALPPAPAATHAPRLWAMLPRKWACPGKPAASRARTFAAPARWDAAVPGRPEAVPT